jgi:hypothetical protein
MNKETGDLLMMGVGMVDIVGIAKWGDVLGVVV